MNYNGQAQQDKFVLSILQEKRDGYFVEIGSNHPININNTYLMESAYDWKGIMIEYSPEHLPSYKEHRANSAHIIQDATTINYRDLFVNQNTPSVIDYLQIDLEVSNRSTLRTLELLDEQVLDTYKFRTVTFEHDIYSGDHHDTRAKSREIFQKRGYILAFADIHNRDPIYPYEDWYVHPEVVNMDYVTALKERNEPQYVASPITGRSIDWFSIDY
jgi:hypothetical protein